jgi:N-acetylneuraminic acid mutarotase
MILLILLATSCDEFAPSPYPTITFQSVAPMPDKGRASAVAWTIDGYGYVALGRTMNLAQLNDCWQYNPASDSWTKMADYPDTARVKAIAAVVNGKAYVGLGFNLKFENGENNVKGNLKGLRSYDPKTNTWSAPLAYFPSVASDACVSAVIGNDIYVLSGFNGGGFMKEVWSYNTVSNTWKKHKDGLYWHARSNAVCLAGDNHFYFGTGYDCKSLNDWWEYYPESETWKQRNAMPDEGRVNALAFSFGDRYFIATGRHMGGDMTGGKLFSDIIEYNPAKDVWYKRGNLPDGGRENAVYFTINGTVYIGAGENSVLYSNTSVLNGFWKCNPL